MKVEWVSKTKKIGVKSYMSFYHMKEIEPNRHLPDDEFSYIFLKDVSYYYLFFLNLLFKNRFLKFLK